MIDKRCVVILGAGASVPPPFHVPVHDQLLDLLHPNPCIVDLAKENSYLENANLHLNRTETKNFRCSIENLLEQLTRLLRKTPNLEAILTVVRVLESIDISKIKTASSVLEPINFPHFGEIIKLIAPFPESFFHENMAKREKSIEKFKKDLYIFLKKVVYDNKQTVFSKDGARKPNPWSAFFEYCDEFDQVTWCSFNWDCLLENSYYRIHCDGKETMKLPDSIVLPEGFEEQLISKNHKFSDTHKLLKLHGGVNLWKPPSPDQMTHKITHLIPGPGKNSSSDWNGYLENRWKNYEGNGESNGYPVILEPSAFKYGDPNFEQLVGQWKEFECELNKANVIIIIGYSMPDFDEKAKSALVSAAENNREAAIIVFDPNRQVYCKYKKVFCKGQTVKKAENPYGSDDKEAIKSELTELYDPTQ